MRKRNYNNFELAYAEIKRIQSEYEGISLRGIAELLNRKKMKTIEIKKFRASTIQYILNRHDYTCDKRARGWRIKAKVKMLYKHLESYKSVAEHLNKMGEKTINGKEFKPMTAKRIVG